MRSPRRLLPALLAAALAAAGCATAPVAAPPPAPIPKGELPEVICQKCGDFVPHGFTCAGDVMLREDVPRSRLGELKRQCQKAAKKRRAG